MNLTEEQWAEIQARSGYRPNPAVVTVAPKLPKPRMNKWETEYSYELEARKQAGEILWWAFEPMKLRLADKTTYTPDFALLITHNLCGVTWGVLQFHEVKGFWRDDARVKIKLAAEMFPFLFVALSRRKGGSGWEREEFRVRK